MIRYQSAKTIKELTDYCNANNISKNDVMSITRSDSFYYMMYEDNSVSNYPNNVSRTDEQ